VNHVAMRISQGLLVAAVATAIFEMNWVISIALFGVGFVGCIFFGFVQARTDDDCYEAAVLEHRLADDPVRIKVTTSGAAVSLIALVVFSVCAFASIKTNTPLPVVTGFIVAATFGVLWYGQVNERRNVVWKQFAGQHDLQFSPGTTWNRLENPRIEGRYADRSMRLETVWQDSGSGGTGTNSRTRKEVLIGEISTSTDDDVSFCVDDGRPKKNEIELAQQLFSSSGVAERLAATQPRRVALFEGSLSFHMPRVPQTVVEMRFYVQLLCDIAVEIERNASGE